MKHLRTGMKPLLGLVFTLSLAVTGSFLQAADEQTTQTRTSSNGDFEVTIDSWLKPLQLGRMHAWTAAINNADGQPITNAEIKVGGGMPIHNHGFPTQPEVTKQVEDGVYLIEGIKFSMGGPWVIILDITSGETVDSVAFDIDM
jgi:hypothetical protein